MPDSADVKVPFFKKKGKGRPTTSRRRSASPPPPTSRTAAASSSKSEVVLPARRAAGGLLSAGTKRTAAQRDAAGDDDDDAAARDGPDVKWTAAGSHVHAALEILAGDEAEALLAAKRQRTAAGGDSEEGEEDGRADDGLYRGQKAYATHLAKSSEVPKAMRVGPQRASGSTIRTVTIVDYQPDVCKDYKGASGRPCAGRGVTDTALQRRAFAGTAIRASSCTTAGHVRLPPSLCPQTPLTAPLVDLQGWQLDKLAENAQQGWDVSDSDSDEEDIPFACLICRKPYTDPVVTRCGHYFDSACAIRRFAKTPKCAACGAPTGGIFNRADKIIEKTRKKREEKEAAEEDDGDGAPGGVEIEGLAQQRSDDGDEDE